MNASIFDEIKSAGLSYRQYFDLTKSDVENSNERLLSDTEKKQLSDKKLNLHRMARIEKHFQVSEELKTIIQSIDEPQTWMIISETWCGDSAQNIPCIAKIAELNPLIDLKIILRDEHPEIMDLYLTNGTRSIPIAVIFSEDGTELLKWGPRPQEAKKLFDDLTAQGIEKSAKLEKLHLWYGRNRGSDLQKELRQMLQMSLQF